MSKQPAPTLTELTYTHPAFTVHTDLTALRVTVTRYRLWLTPEEARQIDLQRRAAEWVLRETREWACGHRVEAPVLKEANTMVGLFKEVVYECRFLKPGQE